MIFEMQNDKLKFPKLFSPKNEINNILKISIEEERKVPGVFQSPAADESIESYKDLFAS